jgi:hypothetical protein
MLPTIEDATAIEKFVLNVTIPILLETANGACLLATGTLFEIADRQFIVTARHIFDDLTDLTRLAFPERPFNGAVHTFGTFQLVKPIKEHVDVAVMELQCGETIAKLKSGWQFLSLSNVALPSLTSPNGAFFLSGYPASLTQNAGEWIESAFATAYTQLIPDVPSEATLPVVPELDLFFDYGHDAISITGKPIKTPKLPGASGASVWEYKSVACVVWNPESLVRVVGVQSSYIHSKYFRAKNWVVVAKVLEQIDPKIAEIVRSKLNEM